MNLRVSSAVRMSVAQGLLAAVWLFGAIPDASAQPIPPQPPVGSLPGGLNAAGDRPCPAPDQMAKWFRGIATIRAEIGTGDRRVPQDCATELFQPGGDGRVARHVADTRHQWAAPELWHQPLYFDDVPLEQYGQTKHPRLQPAISAGRFFLSIPAIPYKMSLDPPFSCVTTLGKYRPGSAAPCVLQLPPWDTRAAIVEGSTIAGLILLLP